MSASRSVISSPMSALSSLCARLARGSAAALVLGTVVATQAQAGRIVVNSDEWTLSDAGYVQAGASNADVFARNLAGFLDGDGTAGGNVLIYSDSFGLTGASLSGSLAGAGYTPTIGTALSFDLATLLGFDAVFLGGSGFAKSDSVLADYVNAGGGVYLAAGTGVGGAAAEAARWNGFLAAFGLALDPVYNGVSGNHPAGEGPLFEGVAQLYFNNGNSVSALPAQVEAGIRMSTNAGLGLIGVYDSGSPDDPSNDVPLPGTAALLGLGLAGLGLRASRQRRA